MALRGEGDKYLALFVACFEGLVEECVTGADPLEDFDEGLRGVIHVHQFAGGLLNQVGDAGVGGDGVGRSHLAIDAQAFGKTCGRQNEGVECDVALPEFIENFARSSALRALAIGEDEDGATVGFGRLLPQEFGCLVNGSVDDGAAAEVFLARELVDGGFDFRDAGGEVEAKLLFQVEAHEGYAVIGLQGSEGLVGLLGHAGDVAMHAAGDVDDEEEIEGELVLRGSDGLTWLVVLGDGEISQGEIANRLELGIDGADFDADQFGFCAEVSSL